MIYNRPHRDLELQARSYFLLVSSMTTNLEPSPMKSFRRLALKSSRWTSSHSQASFRRIFERDQLFDIWVYTYVVNHSTCATVFNDPGISLFVTRLSFLPARDGYLLSRSLRPNSSLLAESPPSSRVVPLPWSAA
jgi:hypothetical protein